jgi:delta 1-pyrroline-5-carboxylate dehydrogenase
MPQVAPVAEWATLSQRLRTEIPEAFTSDGRVLNLIEGEGKEPGFGRHYESPVDGRSLGRIPMIELEVARRALRFAKAEATAWAALDLDQRRRRVAECLDGLREPRELIALLLIWEIGKPYAQALTDVDRCISGVEWYVANIEGMLGGRTPGGLISNIASWNYPMSVLMQAVGAGLGRERVDSQNSDRRWTVCADAGAWNCAPLWFARLAGERLGGPAERGAGAKRIRGLLSLRGREDQRWGHCLQPL